MAEGRSEMTERLHATEIAPRPNMDRPGWIPAHITKDWDPDPYAYQTEEELMAAGGLHGRILTYIVELVRHFIEGRGTMFLVDTFMLYRDGNQIKQRVAPDLLLMPFRFPPPSAYDFDEEPLPNLVIEVTSPESHIQDKETKVNFYLGLGIDTYLVVDAIRPSGRLREQIDLYLWRRVNGQPRSVHPTVDGTFALPELGLYIWAEQHRIHFADLRTGEVLRDMDELRAEIGAVERERNTALDERNAAEHERDVERQARLQLEARVKALEEKLNNQRA